MINYSEYAKKRTDLNLKLEADARSIAKRSIDQTSGEFSRIFKSLSKSKNSETLALASMLNMIFAQQLSLHNQISDFFEDDD